MFPIVQTGKSDQYELICEQQAGVPVTVRGHTYTRNELDQLIILQWPESMAVGEVEALHAELARQWPGRPVVSVIGKLGVWRAKVGARPVPPAPLDRFSQGASVMKTPGGGLIG